MAEQQAHAPEGIRISATIPEECAHLFTEEALRFLLHLERTFGARRKDLLAARDEKQRELDGGACPTFLTSSAEIRASEWTVAPIPADLKDRRVEITGPVDPKMIINALNSPARVFMADFEDSSSPTWDVMVRGQLALSHAVRRTLEYTCPNKDKHYALNPQVATLMVRPRGLHLEEAHVSVDGQPISASLFDFGLYFFHNAQASMDRGSGPYFYIPKLENHLEARWWNDVFVESQARLKIPQGSIRATVLIETILAAFEMDEILYELRDHSAGLNCGRWDYIFSFIKRFRNDPDFILPDRSQVTMDRGFLSAYVTRLIQVCHRRGAHAMGGMAAQIPIKDDPEANQKALDKVFADKTREAEAGHDGTWIAHPGLAPLAFKAFDAVLGEAPHQIDRTPNQSEITPADLLTVPSGSRTEEGLRLNLRVGIQYLEAWLRGVGCVPLYHLMEDAATAEISRAQLWQWLRHHASLEDGRTVDRALVEQLLEEEMQRIQSEVGETRFASGAFTEAQSMFLEMILKPTFDEFLTLPAYRRLLERSN